MRQDSTREEKIKQAKRMRMQRRFAEWRAGLFRPRPRVQGDEVFVDTPFGRVRTLRYGFRSVEPTGSAAATPVYFDLHGGGFMFGRAEKDEAMNLEINRVAGIRIVSIEYGKAPEHPYPVALDQVYAVVDSVLADADPLGIDPTKIAIGGHSAGGNLAAAACIRANRSGNPRFACQILDYPPMDLVSDPFSKPRPEGSIPPEVAVLFDACYISPEQATDPCVSPVYAARDDLAGQPPALVILAGRDSLRDEGLRYARMLQDAGVEVELGEYPGALHGFTTRPSADTDDAVALMAEFLKRRLA